MHVSPLQTQLEGLQKTLMVSYVCVLFRRGKNYEMKEIVPIVFIFSNLFPLILFAYYLGSTRVELESSRGIKW